LWIGTETGGLDKFDPTTGQFTHLTALPDFVRAVYQDQAGQLWVSSIGRGLNQFDSATGRVTRYIHNPDRPDSLSNDFVQTIYVDRAGTLWIGTGAGGLSKADRSAAAFSHYQALPNEPNSLGNNSVWSIAEAANGNLWIGTVGGLDRVDRASGQWTHYTHDPADPNSLADVTVRVVHEDRSGRVWIGLNAGQVDQLDPATGRITHYQIQSSAAERLRATAVLALFEDRAGTLWAGLAGGGLHVFDRLSGQFVPYRSGGCSLCLADAYVRVIDQDRSGTMWIGTAGNGLNAIDPATGQITHYAARPDDPTSLSHNLINAILQDHQGTLWKGTLNGLNRFDAATRTFTRFMEKDGLPNAVVYGLLEDGQGYLWLNTNAGLTRFDPRTVTFTNYDVSDGLQSNEFNAGASFKAPSGELFFGGINGFNAFFPEQVERQNPYVPPVVVTALTRNGAALTTGQLVETARELTLVWPENLFEFEFAALSFAQPGKNQYAYLLEGFDQAWNLIGPRRFGRYTNLPGGTYMLWLKGSNNDRVWNEPGTSIQITVVPPFWETGWFRGTLGLVVIGGLIGGYRLASSAARRSAVNCRRRWRSAPPSCSKRSSRACRPKRLCDKANWIRPSPQSAVAWRATCRMSLHSRSFRPVWWPKPCRQRGSATRLRGDTCWRNCCS